MAALVNSSVAAQTATTQLIIDSEHRLRSENLSWDIDVWYPSVQTVTFPTRFLPMTMKEARAILSFHDVSWRHAKDALQPEEIAILKGLERSIDCIVKEFPGECAFLRLCGRSPKDGEPLDRSSVMQKYRSELASLQQAGMPLNGNTKMIAIARTTTLKVTNGKEAMSLLLTSERVYSDMLDWIKYGEPEQICLRRWDGDLTLEYEFRLFVCNNKVTAISQYDHYTYFPSLAPLKDEIQEGLMKTWAQAHALIGSTSYVVDMGYLPNRPQGDERFIVIELSPFLPCTGASLFNWTSDIDVMEGRAPMEFRIKLEGDIHPQMDDLVEINWDMRWDREFVPYYHWYNEVERKSTNIFRSILEGITSKFTTKTARSIDTIPDEEYKEYLFVYGTLKKRFQWNEKYLAPRVGGMFVSDATTVSNLSLVVGDCGVPYVLGDQEDDPDARPIVGELWRVTESCLRNLDDYEGISKGYYSRQTVLVTPTPAPAKDGEDCTTRSAFIYVLNNSTPELRSQEKRAEYTLELHKSLYHATQHIQIKQKNYYKVASTWGKTQQVFSESSYQVS